MKTPSVLKCLVVDDSALSRKIVRMAVEALPGIEVAGLARDGQDAVSKCREYQPDLVTMDLEMPIMNGIEAVRELRKCCPKAQVIMVSSMTSEGAAVTNQALQAGAFDFVLKPVANSIEESVQQLSGQLKARVDAIRQKQTTSVLNSVSRFSSTPSADSQPKPVEVQAGSPSANLRALCIGISTGGPNALAQLIPALPTSMPVPVFIVQHMPAVFTKSLANQLDRNCRLDVCEAADGDDARPGQVFIAPGGKQMRLDANLNRIRIQVTDDAPECNAKPSVDYLFRSAAQQLRGDVISMVMTGMGDDGLAGCQLIRKSGGYIMTQDEASCTVYGMPRRVAEAGLSNFVGNVDELAGHLLQILPSGVLSCK